MKIILIRQAEPDMKWEERYDAAGFARASEAAQNQSTTAAPGRRSDAAAYRVYTGTSRAAAETAELLFELAEPPVKTPLLDDVQLRPFRDTDKKCPLWQWRTVGALQWVFGSDRQAESGKETLARLRGFVDRLESEDRDCIVICGGPTLAMLKGILRFRGYCLEGGELVPKPLDRIRATKQSLHCGGCHHNCLLSAPKCQIGQNKARSRDSQDRRLSR